MLDSLRHFPLAFISLLIEQMLCGGHAVCLCLFIALAHLLRSLHCVESGWTMVFIAD